MSKADEYVANAAECQRMADLSKHPAEKELWRQMAESWRRMVPSRQQRTRPGEHSTM